jgi:hypothetical protein
MVHPLAKLVRRRDATLPRTDYVRKPIPMTRVRFAALMLMLALALTACPQSSDDANPDASTSTEGTASTELATSSAPTSSAVPTTTTSTIPTPPVWNAVQPGPGNSGAFLGLSTGLFRSERAPRFRSIEEASGRTYDIGHVFHAWDMAIPTSDDLMHISDNRLLMISWNGTDTIEIAAGDHDDWIRTQARHKGSWGSCAVPLALGNGRPSPY